MSSKEREAYKRGYEAFTPGSQCQSLGAFQDGWNEAKSDYEETSEYKFGLMSADCPWNDYGNCLVTRDTCCPDGCAFYHWRET